MKLIRSILVAVILIAVLAAGYYVLRSQMQKTTITTFEECAAAGYPVQESYPEICRTPDGQSFTRPVN